MARAVVFVDDAVLGRLPAVCVRSGVPADGVVEQRQRVHRPGPWVWALVFLGPPGWLAVLLAVTTGGRPFTVRLPVSNAAFARWHALHRLGHVAVAAAVVTSVLLATRLLPTRVGVGVLVASFLAALALRALAYASQVGVDLDASGRWVTLTGVSPAFAAAVTVTVAPGRQRVGW